MVTRARRTPGNDPSRSVGDPHPATDSRITWPGAAGIAAHQASKCQFKVPMSSVLRTCSHPRESAMGTRGRLRPMQRPLVCRVRVVSIAFANRGPRLGRSMLAEQSLASTQTPITSTTASFAAIDCGSRGSGQLSKLDAHVNFPVPEPQATRRQRKDAFRTRNHLFQLVTTPRWLDRTATATTELPEGAYHRAGAALRAWDRAFALRSRAEAPAAMCPWSVR